MMARVGQMSLQQCVLDLESEIVRSQHTLVLVEGPNDKKALERLGFRRVLHLHRPLHQMVEMILEEEEVLVLTDLDEHGKGLYKYFYHELTRRGVRVDNRLRLLLLQTPVRQIEGLASWIERESAF
jgi:5S rRNA maturation endonuclease (ribonuclease M5)